MDISATQMTLTDECDKREPRFQSQTFARKYLGGFNTVSMRQIGTDPKDRYADKTYLSGGSIVCVPVQAAMDILPCDDPNLFTVNKKSQGRLPIEIYGSAELDDVDVINKAIKVNEKYQSKEDAKATVEELFKDTDLILTVKTEHMITFTM